MAHEDEPSPELTLLPINQLLESSLMTDYNDGIFGWINGDFDEETGVLELTFEKDEYQEVDPQDSETLYESVTYRFQLLQGDVI